MNKIYLCMAVVALAMVGCATQDGNVHQTLVQACQQAAGDLNIPAGTQVIIGPIVHNNKKVTFSNKFGDTLHAELTKRGVVVLQRERLDAILMEQKITLSSLFDQKHKIGGLLKADYIILGRTTDLNKASLKATIVVTCDNVQQARSVTSSTVNVKAGEDGDPYELKWRDFYPPEVVCSDPQCPICGGKGEYVCQTCQGAGHSMIPCTACSQQGYTPCTKCAQTGQCIVCGGSGRDTMGMVCASCQGTGKCTCDAGKVLCQQCQGKGEIKKKCLTCNDEGKFTHIIKQ